MFQITAVKERRQNTNYFKEKLILPIKLAFGTRICVNFDVSIVTTILINRDNDIL